jgi:YidC/Oxa1 family membrane protein insertase
MEKRAILAAVLMAVLLVVYQTFFLPSYEAPPDDRQVERPAPAPQAPAVTEAPRPAAPPPAPAARAATVAEAREVVRPPQRTATVEGPLYRGTVSSAGGKLQEWILQYRGDKPMVKVGEQGPAGLRLATPPGGTSQVLAMTLSPEALSLGPGRPAGELVLEGQEGDLAVRQTLGLAADRFAIDIALRVENRGPGARAVEVELPWATRASWKDVPEAFPGQHATEVVWQSAEGVHRVHELDKLGDRVIEGSWVGAGSIWYLAALVPRTPGFQLVLRDDKAGAEAAGEGRAVVAVRATPTIAPGQAWEGRVVLYVGPKEYERLRALGLEGTLDFGGFPLPRAYGGLPMEWIGVPILLLMKWVYSYVHNYGIAIILLTVVSKVLFFPLTVKSMRSMKAMQALGPQVNALRSKYKSDPQRLQRETMDLYRKYKVNPLGGCLPMIAQVPVFYALYLALSVAVELQNAPFLCFGRLFGVHLWICDLSSHDPTYVLPILMGVTMFVQQKMMPTVGDPRQAKMMLMMPVIFTFMFLNLPSGLVLYWTVSNVLQILQQYYMDRLSAKGAAREVKEASRA